MEIYSAAGYKDMEQVKSYLHKIDDVRRYFRASGTKINKDKRGRKETIHVPPDFENSIHLLVSNGI